MAVSGVTLADVQLRYPSVYTDWTDTVVIATVAAQILEAEDDVGGVQFDGNQGKFRKRAIVSLVAHRSVLRNQELDGDLSGKFILGQVSAGGVSMAFVVPPPHGTAPQYAHYYTTQPGIDYQEMVSRNLGPGIRLAVAP